MKQARGGLSRRALTLVVAAVAACALLGAARGSAQTPQDVVVSANPANWTPWILDGYARAVAQVGNKVIVGGNFTQVQEPGNGPVLTRNNIFAFDATTGKIDPAFTATVDNRIDDLVAAPDGTGVFAAGFFQNVNGVARRGLVELSAADGSIVPTFKGYTAGAVLDIDLNANRLFLGGYFWSVDGRAWYNLAAVNATTGALDTSVKSVISEVRNSTTTQGKLGISHVAVSPDGTRLVIGGNFNKVDGLYRYQLAVYDVTQQPAVLADWETDRYQPICPQQIAPSYIHDIDFSPDGGWFVVVTSGAYNGSMLCDTAARWEIGSVGSHLQPTWVDYTGGDTMTALEVTRTAVYVGGHQRWMNNSFADNEEGPGAVAREGLAALDPANGLPFSWNPGRARGQGPEAMLATDAGLWVAHDTNSVGGEWHPRLAFFPAGGGTAVSAPVVGQLPGTLYKLGLKDTMVGESFDGTAFGSPTTLTSGSPSWSHSRGSFLVNDKLYSGWDDGKVYVRSFDGTTLGPAVEVALNGLSNLWGVKQLTGMFFEPDLHRVYYTLSGSRSLYYRYFTPQSEIFGASRFVTASTGGVDWSSVRGMTLAGGRIYYADSGGNLRSIAFANGAPVLGTGQLVSSAVKAPGGTWRSNGLVIR